MQKISVLLGAAIIALLALFFVSSRFSVDLLWFTSLGYRGVVTTAWLTMFAVFVIALALSAGILLLNGLIALGTTAASTSRKPRFRVIGRGGQGAPEVIEISLDKLPLRLIVVAVALLVGVFIGGAQPSNGDTLLKWFYAAPFGRSDPLFGNDLGFYVFSLPVYELLKDWALLVIFFSGAIAVCIYVVRGDIDYQQAGFPTLSSAAIRHLSVLLAIYFLVKAAGYLLQRYDLLTSNNGIVFGAAYTDVHLRLPLLIGLTGAALIAAALCAYNIWQASIRLPIAAVAVVFAVSLVHTLIPGLFQSYWVKPDELKLESRYIARNIDFTRYGFGIDNITSAPFPGKGKLTAEVIAANQATIQNIRWWDPRPLLDTYRQLQEIRLYYDFHDIDVDRYTLNGSYRQVLLAARELNQSKLPADAQTWINQRFKFTHGNGLAMNPVNRFDNEGLPEFYLKDIPPVGPPELKIDRPEIYFGEQTPNYVVVGGGTKEFDYAKGQENVYNVYEGRDGVSLSALWRRALFAWYFGDFKLLISENVTAGSKILFRRLIQERIQRIAPFLKLDRDPYLVVNDGRLIWLQDAYTVSDSLPYSQTTQTGINYIRNSVKIAVDAYDGNPIFYIADPKDPIVLTYQRIFPTLFQPIAAMPASLHKHVRYPEDLFIIQAKVYGTYHMKDPEVFYNKEDLWNFPRESHKGQTGTMQPYYTIMKLPGEPREEFILMLPMVPNNRDNMIAWLAARCDGDNYGKVIEYNFSKEKLIYGPAQIEARIDQDTTISQQLSLWNQAGSRVIRGNLLAIPIDDTVLYVEPLYLSAESRQLPELKRLIASTGDRVVMAQDVDSLLAALVTPEERKAPPVVASTSAITPGARAPESPPAGANAEALNRYRRAFEALNKGDWRTFGAEMDAMQKALQGPAAAKPAP